MNSLLHASLRLAFVLGTVVTVSSAFGIIATTSMTDAGPVDTSYAYVGQMNGSSAVAVGPNKVLTAYHVGAGDFVLNGVTYHSIGPSGVSAAPDYIDPTDPTHKAHVDLRLITVSETLPGWYDVGVGASVGSTITMVGFGRSGVLNRDSTGYTITINPGDRRKGDNSVDEKGVIYNSSPTTSDGWGPYMASYLKVKGNAVLAGNDSGGGWFQDGRLVGISSFVFNLTQPDANTNPTYGNYGFGALNTNGYHDPYVDLEPGEAYFGSGAMNLTDPQIQTWLRTQGVVPVPEPASMVVLGLGAAAMLRRKRK